MHVDSTTTQLRTCRECKRRLPLDRFYATGAGNGRRTTCTRCMNGQAERERRARGAKVRHNRYNARGHVYCNHCQAYLSADSFKRHPSRPHTFWAYCRPCVRTIDRARYRRKTSTPEGAKRELESRYRRKRRQLTRERRERKNFVAHAIDLLLRRGFTKVEVSRLAQTSPASLYSWIDPKANRLVTTAVEGRFSVLLFATGDLPLVGYQPYRRKPHPDYARIHAITSDDVQRYRVRNSWINGRRAA